MKVVLKSQQGYKIPEVGDVWHHQDSLLIYMRVETFGTFTVHNLSDGYFCSVNLADGKLVQTPSNSRNCIIIKSAKDTLEI